MPSLRLLPVLAVAGVLCAESAPQAAIIQHTLTGSGVVDTSTGGFTGQPLDFTFNIRSDAPVIMAGSTLSSFEGNGCSFSLGGNTWSSPTCGVEQSRGTTSDTITFTALRNPAFGPADVTGPALLQDAFFTIDTSFGSLFASPDMLFTDLTGTSIDFLVLRSPLVGLNAASVVNFSLASAMIPDVPPVSVPLPASLYLFLTGLLGLICIARRRTTALA